MLDPHVHSHMFLRSPQFSPMISHDIYNNFWGEIFEQCRIAYFIHRHNGISTIS